MAKYARSTSHAAGLYGSVCQLARLHMVTITPNCEAQSREFAIPARYRSDRHHVRRMSNQTGNLAKTPGGAKANPSSPWKDMDGAAAPSENPSDTTWFVPPIIVPVLLALLVAVRV